VVSSIVVGIFVSLISGAARIAKTINDNKAMQRQLEELKRVMDDHGVYLAPYKRERRVTNRKNKD